jgi:hypothetical protein
MTIADINSLFLCLRFKLKSASSDKLLCYLILAALGMSKSVNNVFILLVLNEKHYCPIRMNTIQAFEVFWTARGRSEPASNEHGAAILGSSFMKISRRMDQVTTATRLERQMRSPVIETLRTGSEMTRIKIKRPKYLTHSQDKNCLRCSYGYCLQSSWKYSKLTPVTWMCNDAGM